MLNKIEIIIFLLCVGLNIYFFCHNLFQIYQQYKVKYIKKYSYTQTILYKVIIADKGSIHPESIEIPPCLPTEGLTPTEGVMKMKYV